jgi:glycine betaine catabolism B
MRKPKVQLALLLFVFFLIVSFHIGFSHAIYLLTICLSSCYISDVLFTFLRRKKLFTPQAGLATGIILTLIIDPGAALYQIVIICAGAMAIKNFLRVSGRHIFNPAASGMLIGFMFFGLQPSWWGATLYSTQQPFYFFNIILYGIILLIFYISGIRLRRKIAIATFLLAYPLISQLPSFSFSHSPFLVSLTSIGSLFYAFIMLPEPMTSPVTPKRQILYGLTLAILQTFFIFLLSNNIVSTLPDSSLLALLSGNLLFFKYK